VAESLFTTETPSGTDNTDGTPGITTATSMIFAVAGTITHVRFYSTLHPSGTYTGLVWHVDSADPNASGGTLLASKSVSSGITGGGWNTITLDTPVSVSTSTLYRIGLHSDAGLYVNTGTFFTSSLTTGNITAPHNGDDPVGLGSVFQGTFAVNASPTYPTTAFNANSYFIDVVFVAGGAPTGTTPNGLAIPVSYGSPTAALGLSTAPAGLAIPASLGQPTASLNRSAAPTGISVPVSLGTPSTAYNLTTAPAGLGIPVSFGSPSVGAQGALPAGLAVPVSLGTPSASYALSGRPNGLAVAIHLGQPSTQPPTVSRSGLPRLVTGSTGHRISTSTRQGRITD
jgi:hypothetical protein